MRFGWPPWRQIENVSVALARIPQVENLRPRLNRAATVSRPYFSVTSIVTGSALTLFAAPVPARPVA